jgi:hypothetical protein
MSMQRIPHPSGLARPADLIRRRNWTRRTFLGLSAAGLGSIALSTLWGSSSPATAADLSEPGVVYPRHVRPRAKRVIFLCMAGGPSHLETLDYKPKLAQMHGQPMPTSLTQGQPIAQLQGQALKCLGPQHAFARHGQSGQQMSTLFRYMPRIADDICIVRSMRTEQINHDPAHTFMNTGTAISGRPSMGSWVLYGLGRETDSLPGFVVLTSHGGGQDQPIAARQWHCGFLPSEYQGVQFQSTGDPVLYAGSPPGVGIEDQRLIVDSVNQLNRLRGTELPDAEIDTRITQYEMAFKMQASVPDLMDLSDEPPHVFELYGTRGGDGSFAGNCLLARRLAERGVRFIQLYHRGWDHHGGVKQGTRVTSQLVDQGTAALVLDLKQRGMLDDTLVIWAGEFGRTPMAQGDGRDHHIKGFSLWMAGGGIKGGISYGATDELGYNAVDNIVHVHDLHATMLHLLGIDHQRLTFRFQGRDFRLTDVHGSVVHDVLA